MGLTLNEIRKRLKERTPHVPEKSEEELLREEFPGLQDAWEKYQIVLKMVKASRPQLITEAESELNAKDLLDQIRTRNKKISRNGGNFDRDEKTEQLRELYNTKVNKDDRLRIFR